jgi:hypothetical protein
MSNIPDALLLLNEKATPASETSKKDEIAIVTPKFDELNSPTRNSGSPTGCK